MIRYVLVMLLALPVVLLGGLLAFVVFGPNDIPPIIALAIAVGIVMGAAYAIKLGRNNQ